jgi:hypothetical protein
MSKPHLVVSLKLRNRQRRVEDFGYFQLVSVFLPPNIGSTELSFVPHDDATDQIVLSGQQFRFVLERSCDTFPDAEDTIDATKKPAVATTVN